MIEVMNTATKITINNIYYLFFALTGTVNPVYSLDDGIKCENMIARHHQEKSMLPLRDKRRYWKSLKTKGVSVVELVEALGVSHMTIRRDIQRLSS